MSKSRFTTAILCDKTPIVQKYANCPLDFLLARGMKRKDFCANADG